MDGLGRSACTWLGAVITDRAWPVKAEDGQDMIEYALLAALISIAAIAIVILVGPYLKDLFQDVVNGLGSA
jgi:pilus assembly protein Flp/PilA